MLLNHLDIICKSALIPPLIILVCTFYTYFVNLQRQPDDPKKRTYHPFAILLAPISVPLFLTFGILLFILRALLFAGFLTVFTVFLLGFRKPILLVWWDKFATRIGDPLLKLNTYLIKMAFNP